MRHASWSWVRVVCAGVLALPAAAAATLGNPMVIENPTLAVGFETEFVSTDIAGDPIDSKRYLAKASYPVAPWAQISVRAGAGDIDVIGRIGNNSVAMNSEPKFAWGGGVRIEPWRNEDASLMPGLILAAEGLMLRSSGSGEVDLTFPSATLRQRFDTEYRWREFQGTAAVLFRMTSFFPYAGVTFRGVEGEVKRLQTDVSGSSPTVVASSEQDFGSSLSPYLLAGFDYRVTSDFRLSTEGFVKGGDDYGFFVGFSQAGD